MCKKRLPDQPYHRLCGARQIVDIGRLPSSEKKIKSNDFIRENAVQFEIILEYVAYHCHDFFVTQDIVNLQMGLSVIPCQKRYEYVIKDSCIQR